MSKVISIKEAIEKIEDGMSIFIGGFMANGTPEILIDALVNSKAKDLTIIANDAGLIDRGIGKLLLEKKVKKLIASHIGLNPEAGRQMNSQEMEVELVPQGTLAEQIRAGGAGLGGILTATGVGTVVEEGKQVIKINSEKYLLELPIRADIALIRGSIVDESGNVYYNKSTRNFNTLMATAADTVIVATEKLVETGTINPNDVMTPNIFVDYIVEGEKKIG